VEEQADRPLAEDLACPVEVEPGVDSALPPDWSWRRVDTSQPNKATFHINHSDVTRVLVDVLRPSDGPPDAQLVISRDIPIVVIDSLDRYWAGESKSTLPLHGLRVPMEADTLEGAKRALAEDLIAQLRLLILLSSSHRGEIAAELKQNLIRLTEFLSPSPPPQQKSG
jgi:hypothetical protein